MTGDLVAGVDIGGTSMRAAVVGGGGKVGAVVSVPSDPGLDPAESLEPLLSGLDRLMGEADAHTAAVGVGVAGLVDHARGVVLSSPNLPLWSDLPIGGIFEERFNLPTAVLNDAGAFALGEASFGAGRDAGDVLYVTIGTGIGGAIHLGGRLRLGPHETAGEIGHMTFVPGGRSCGCGKRGCLERYIGRDAIISAYTASRGEGEEDLTPREIAERAEGGDPAALEAFAGAARALGTVIGSLVEALDLERIVIGGGIAGAGEVLFGPLRAAFLDEVQSYYHDKVELLPAALGENASLAGAAEAGRLLLRPPGRPRSSR